MWVYHVEIVCFPRASDPPPSLSKAELKVRHGSYPLSSTAVSLFSLSSNTSQFLKFCCPLAHHVFAIRHVFYPEFLFCIKTAPKSSTTAFQRHNLGQTGNTRCIHFERSQNTYSQSKGILQLNRMFSNNTSSMAPSSQSPPPNSAPSP
jgi:hypothetical protein